MRTQVCQIGAIAVRLSSAKSGLPPLAGKHLRLLALYWVSVESASTSAVLRRNAERNQINILKSQDTVLTP